MGVGLETPGGVRKRLVVVREWVVGFENAGLGLRARGTVREWVVGFENGWWRIVGFGWVENGWGWAALAFIGCRGCIGLCCLSLACVTMAMEQQGAG